MPLFRTSKWVKKIMARVDGTQQTLADAVSQGAGQQAAIAQHLQKHRRNVMLTAALMTFILVTGAKIGDALSVQGLTLTFQRREWIEPSLWIVMFYFWIRYLQHYNEYSLNPFSALWMPLHEKAKQLAMQAARPDIMSKHPELDDSTTDLVPVLRTPPRPVGPAVDMRTVVRDGWVFDIKFVYMLKAGQTVKTAVELRDAVSVTIPNVRLRAAKAGILTRQAMTLTPFIEYVLPALLPLLPMSMQLCQWIATIR